MRNIKFLTLDSSGLHALSALVVAFSLSACSKNVGFGNKPVPTLVQAPGTQAPRVQPASSNLVAPAPQPPAAQITSPPQTPVPVDGGTWLNGNGAPSANLGKVNDLYLDNTTQNYYVKTLQNGWVFEATLHGANGTSTSSNSSAIVNQTDGGDGQTPPATVASSYTSTPPAPPSPPPAQAPCPLPPVAVEPPPPPPAPAPCPQTAPPAQETPPTTAAAAGDNSAPTNPNADPSAAIDACDAQRKSILAELQSKTSALVPMLDQLHNDLTSDASQADYTQLITDQQNIRDTTVTSDVKSSATTEYVQLLTQHMQKLNMNPQGQLFGDINNDPSGKSQTYLGVWIKNAEVAAVYREIGSDNTITALKFNWSFGSSPDRYTYSAQTLTPQNNPTLVDKAGVPQQNLQLQGEVFNGTIFDFIEKDPRMSACVGKTNFSQDDQTNFGAVNAGQTQ